MYNIHVNACAYNVTLMFAYVYREKDRPTLGPPVIPANRADLPRFTGGGFNLKQSQKAIA